MEGEEKKQKQTSLCYPLLLLLFVYLQGIKDLPFSEKVRSLLETCFCCLCAKATGKIASLKNSGHTNWEKP